MPKRCSTPRCRCHLPKTGLTYKGTNNGGAVPQEFLPFLVNLYKAGRYPVDKLIKVSSRAGRCALFTLAEGY